MFKTALSILILMSLPIQCFGSGIPSITFDQKVASADVIIRAKVVKIDDIPSGEKPNVITFGPRGLATLQLLKTYHKKKGAKVLSKIKIHCGYKSYDSPSLTNGREYFMFLTYTKEGKYAPIDSASMHPVYHKRVITNGRDIGFDVYDNQAVFEQCSIPLEDFEKNVAALWKNRKKHKVIEKPLRIRIVE